MLRKVAQEVRVVVRTSEQSLGPGGGLQSAVSKIQASVSFSHR